MKFITKKEEIVESLQLGSAIAERRQTIPILANLRMVTKDNLIEITATDLEIQTKTKTKITSTLEEGETTVSARKMSELCRSLPDKEELEFSLNNGKLSVSSKNFSADFATLSATDFPEFDFKEKIYSLKLSSNTVKRLLTKTLFSMASQDVRYYLNGLLIEVRESEIYTVATDGHRLALAKQKLSSSVDKFTRQIVPRKAVQELAKILKTNDSPVELSFSTSGLKVTDDSLEFSSKLIDGKFPDYEKVFPSGESNKMIIPKNDLQSALLRASVLSNEKYRGVRFEIKNNSLKLTANNPEKESAEELLEVKYQGQELEIGFNIGYLLDVINIIETDDIELNFYGEESSCLAKEPGSDSELYVIMPMRL